MSASKLFYCIFIVIFIMTGCDGGEKKVADDGLKEWTGQGASPVVNRIENLKASLYETPDNVDLISALADAYFESGKYPDAIKEYEKALKIKPHDVNNLNDAGLAYFYIGDLENGLAYIEKAIKLDPSYKNARLSKGYMLLSVGRPEEAIEPLEKAKELDPTGPLGVAASDFLAKIKTIMEKK